MDSRGKRVWRRGYTRAMNWIRIINDELPRLRPYASAVFGGPAEGDLAVEAALGDLFEGHLADPLDRALLYRLLDRQARSLAGMPASERVELLKHLAGFEADEAHGIVQWDSLSPLRSVS
jgi:hypothetical protein